MKTAISVPNPIYEEAERLAQSTNKSRSQIYSEALAEYLARHAMESVTERMNRVCAALAAETSNEGSEEKAWSEAAARSTLERVEW